MHNIYIDFVTFFIFFIFFFCLETKEAKIQGLQMTNLKTTSAFALRTKPFAFQAQLQVRCHSSLRCFLRLSFDALAALNEVFIYFWLSAKRQKSFKERLAKVGRSFHCGKS